MPIDTSSVAEKVVGMIASLPVATSDDLKAIASEAQRIARFATAQTDMQMRSVSSQIESLGMRTASAKEASAV